MAGWLGLVLLGILAAELQHLPVHLLQRLRRHELHRLAIRQRLGVQVRMMCEYEDVTELVCDSGAELVVVQGCQKVLVKCQNEIVRVGRRAADRNELLFSPDDPHRDLFGKRPASPEFLDNRKY